MIKNLKYIALTNSHMKHELVLYTMKNCKINQKTRLLTFSIFVFNGRSHVKATLMVPGITIPFQDHKLIHGTWQQIVYIELDTSQRNRTIIIQTIGEE